MHPNLLLIFVFVSNFCWERDIKMVVSSVYRYSNDGISESTTHQQMRAFDLDLSPSLGWTSDRIDDLFIEVSKKFKKIGATSIKTGNKRPIYIHGNSSGDGEHAHIQVANDPKYMRPLIKIEELGIKPEEIKDELNGILTRFNKTFDRKPRRK